MLRFTEAIGLMRSVGILGSIVCSKPFVWLFSPALDDFKLACQEVGIFCPFVVIDPTYSGVTLQL
jgi:hypothetical protein